MNRLTCSILMLLAILILAGCPFRPPVPPEETGTIALGLNLTGEAAARFGDLRSIEVVATKGSLRVTQTIDTSGNTLSGYDTSLEELDEGIWQLTARGLDSQNICIVSGTQTVTVNAGSLAVSNLLLSLVRVEVTITVDAQGFESAATYDLYGQSSSGYSLFLQDQGIGTLSTNELLAADTWELTAELYTQEGVLLATGTIEQLIEGPSQRAVTIPLEAVDAPTGTVRLILESHRSIASRLDSFSVTASKDLLQRSFSYGAGEPLVCTLEVGLWDFEVEALDEEGDTLATVTIEEVEIGSELQGTATGSLEVPLSELSLDMQIDSSYPDFDHLVIYGSSPYDHCSHSDLEPGDSVYLSYGQWELYFDLYDSEGGYLGSEELELDVTGPTSSVGGTFSREGTLLLSIFPDQILSGRGAEYHLEGESRDGDFTLPELVSTSMRIERDLPVGVWDFTLWAEKEGMKVSTVANIEGVTIEDGKRNPQSRSLVSVYTPVSVTVEYEDRLEALVDHVTITALSPYEARTATVEDSLRWDEELSLGQWVISANAIDSTGKTIATGEQTVLVTATPGSQTLELETLIDKGQLSLQLRPENLLAQEVAAYSLELTRQEDLSRVSVPHHTGSIWSGKLTSGLWDISVRALDEDSAVISQETLLEDVEVPLGGTLIQTASLYYVRHEVELTIDTGTMNPSPDHYLLEGVCDKDSFSLETEGLLISRELIPGDWSLSLTAFDQEDEPIAAYERDLSITADTVLVATLEPIIHTGSLFVAIEADEFVTNLAREYELVDLSSSDSYSTTSNSLSITDIPTGEYSFSLGAYDTNGGLLAQKDLSTVLIEKESRSMRTESLEANRSDLSVNVGPSIEGIASFTLVGYSESDAFVEEGLSPAVRLESPERLTVGQWRFILIGYDQLGIPVARAVITDEDPAVSSDGVNECIVNLSLSAIEQENSSRSLFSRGGISEPVAPGILVLKTSLHSSISGAFDYYTISLTDSSGDKEVLGPLTDLTHVIPEISSGDWTVSLEVFDSEGTLLASNQSSVSVPYQDVVYSERLLSPPFGELELTLEAEQVIETAGFKRVYHLWKEGSEEEILREVSGDLAPESFTELGLGQWSFAVELFEAQAQLIATAEGTFTIEEGITSQVTAGLSPVTSRLVCQIDDASLPMNADHFRLVLENQQGWAQVVEEAPDAQFVIEDLPWGDWELTCLAFDEEERLLGQGSGSTFTVDGRPVILQQVGLVAQEHSLTLSLTPPSGTAPELYRILATNGSDLVRSYESSEDELVMDLPPALWDLEVTALLEAKAIASVTTTTELVSDTARELSLGLITQRIIIDVKKSADFRNAVSSWVLEGSAEGFEEYSFRLEGQNAGLFETTVPAADWTIEAKALDESGATVSLACSRTISTSSTRQSALILECSPLVSELSLDEVNAVDPSLSYVISGTSSQDALYRLSPGTDLAAQTFDLSLGLWDVSILGYDTQGRLRARAEGSVISDGQPKHPVLQLQEVTYEGSLILELDPSQYLLQEAQEYLLEFSSGSRYSSVTTSQLFHTTSLPEGDWQISCTALDPMGSAIAHNSTAITILPEQTLFESLQLEQEQASLYIEVLCDPDLEAIVDTYELSLSGPDGVEIVSQSSATFSFSDLTPGQWSIKVSGKHENGNPIARGEQVITLSAGQQAFLTPELNALTGDLSIRLVPESSIQQQIASYTITLEKDGSIREAAGLSAGSHLFEELPVGSWNVAGMAFDAAGTLIGSASSVGEVLDGRLSSQSLPVEATELAFGQIRVEVTHPGNTTVLAELISGTSVSTALENTAEAGVTIASAESLIPGYYVLKLSLYEEGILIGSKTSAVQIRGGELLDLSATLEADEGTLTLVISESLSDLAQVEIQGIRDGELFDLEDEPVLRLSATTSVLSATFQWYLNGSLLQESSSNLLLEGLEPDHYEISCIAIGSDTLGSATVSFDIYE